MDPSVLLLLVAVLVVAALVFVAVSISSKKAHVFDIEEYQATWLKLENALDKTNRSSYAISVINADKLLDKAMHEMGIPGKTMGDRLKKLGTMNKLSQLNSVWYAHKIRNQIAHDSHFEVEYNQAKHALTVYKQALKDLGAI